MRILDQLNERFGFTGRHRRILDKPVPGWINYFYCFGGITFTLFLILLLTGLLLSAQYTPTESEAFRSIQRLHREVPLGGFIQAAHHWAGNLMVVMIVLHMLRVFVTGSYKNPRELHWVGGSFLLLLTFAFGFTGYLLPWDQKAYWATVIGTNMVGSTPLVGTFFAGLLRGGAEVTGATLLRFYSMHILWLPLFTGLFLWLHFHMIKRTGISGRL
jgi:quinol-cytochrome oxidoreductase complex cytochrome b subunit